MKIQYKGVWMGKKHNSKVHFWIDWDDILYLYLVNAGFCCVNDD